MNFCFNIELRKIDINNDDHLDILYDFFTDETLFNFIHDNRRAEHLYFIIENGWETIGFVYLIPLSKPKESEVTVYNVKYGFRKDKLNEDYAYTVLTHVRDKVKGFKGSAEIKGSQIITGLKNYDKTYNDLASKFGNMIYQTDDTNYYAIAPNCEDINLEVDNEVKVLKYHSDNRAV